MGPSLAPAALILVLLTLCYSMHISKAAHFISSPLKTGQTLQTDANIDLLNEVQLKLANLKQLIARLPNDPKVKQITKDLAKQQKIINAKVKVKVVTNVDALKQANNYIESENHTLAQLNSSVAAEKLPTQPCPADKPVFGGSNKTCFACPSGEFLLLSNLSCIVCPKGEFIFLSNHSCYKLTTFTNTNTLKTLANVVQRGNDTLKSIEEEIKKQTNPVAVCDSTEPMFNGTACVKCSDKEFYVLDKKKCEAPVWVSNTDALILANQYLEAATANMTSLTESNKKTPKPKKACPTETPLFNGSACVSCSSSLYSLESMKCANCISSFYYDTKTHTCKETFNFFPNLTNHLWIVSTDSGIKNLQNLVKQRKALKNALECPVDKPHFNNDTKDCQKCLDKEFFDYDLRKCTVCGSGLEVDVNTRKCGKRIVGVYQTSLNARNLLYDGKPKAQLSEEWVRNKKTYPLIRNCLTNKPYFDGFGCIACPSSNPLFSLLSKLCSSCPEGSHYDTQGKQCVGHTGQLITLKPNIGRIYSSIF